MCNSSWHPKYVLKKSIRGTGKMLKGDIGGAMEDSLQLTGDLLADRQGIKKYERAQNQRMELAGKQSDFQTEQARANNTRNRSQRRQAQTILGSAPDEQAAPKTILGG